MADKASKIFVKGSVKHDGTTFNKQYISVPDQIDQASADRLVALGYAYVGREARELARETDQAEAEAEQAAAMAQQAEAKAAAEAGRAAATSTRTSIKKGS